jgi:thiol-disulfide isomerase/thioredoxin
MTTAIFPNLQVTVLDRTGTKRDLKEFCQGKIMVLDFWHTKCVKCPSALEKLDDVARDFGKEGQVIFVACALSLGEGNKDLVLEMISDSWDNLVHVFMDIDEKEKAKAEFGFNAVPFVLVVDQQGTILGMGDPKAIDYLDLINSALAPTPTRATLVLDEDF